MTKRSSPVKTPQVGTNVRRLRTAAKISIREFCSKVDPPIAPVQLLATELHKSEPTLEMTQRYARALGVTVEKLMEQAATEKKAPHPRRRKEQSQQST